MPESKKYALVLSGGGFRGAFQAGALQVLQENWKTLTGQDGDMQFDLIAGVSAGALNGAMVAMQKLDVLQNIWNEVAERGVEVIYTSDFIDTRDRTGELKLDFDLKVVLERFLPGIDLNFGRILGVLFSPKKRRELTEALREGIRNFRAVADNSPLRQLLEKHLEREAIRHGTFYCGFVSLDSGNYYGVPHHDFISDDAFVHGVLASTTMPLIWEPEPYVQVEGYTSFQNVDGGLKNLSPLGELIGAIHRQEDPEADYTIFIVNCSNGHLGHKRMSKSNAAEIAMRALVEIAMDEIFENDLREFLRINDLLLQMREADLSFPLRDFDFRTGKRGHVLKPFRSVLIQPDSGILGDSLTAGKGATELRIQHGRVKALKAVQHMREKPPSVFRSIIA